LNVALNEELPKPIFEIHDSEINVREIMEEIESRLRKKNVSADEITRLSHLDSTPISPAGNREFDPANTAYLFDKGISAPKFTNPSLWFVRGPLKWIFKKIVEIYSLLDKKLSENRIKAFYSVVHELILQKAKTKELEKKFEELYSDYSALKAELGKNRFEFILENEKPFILKPSSLYKKIISRLHEKQETLVIEPIDSHLLQKLKTGGYEISLLVFHESAYHSFKKNVTDSITLISEIDDFTGWSKTKNIIFGKNICLYPAYYLENLLYILQNRTIAGSKIVIYYCNHSVKEYSPFQEIYLTRISREKLLNRLKELGFKNIVSEEIAADNYTIFSFEKL
jgi:hypothetical protein